MGLVPRVGVHTGEVEVRGNFLAGLTVTIAKRVCDLAGPSQILASERVKSNMVGADTQFADQGDRQLKGVPGSGRLFSAECSRTHKIS
jgi:class 3 adenylate cyclase